MFLTNRQILINQGRNQGQDKIVRFSYALLQFLSCPFSLYLTCLCLAFALFFTLSCFCLVIFLLSFFSKNEPFMHISRHYYDITTPGGEKLEDERLVAAAKKGNSKAFETLVDRYHNQLYFTALGILRSGWDALDVCQETFLKAFSSIDTLKDNTKFKAWITKILINKSNDHLRKSKKTVLVENFIEDVKSQGFFENFDGSSVDLLKALDNLNEQTRTAIYLRYFQDLSIKEIAQVMNCPEGTVKSRISNGLKEMRLLL